MSNNFIIVLTLDKPVFQGFGAQSLSFDFFKNSVEVNGIIYTTICRLYIFDKLFVSHCKIGKKCQSKSKLVIILLQKVGVNSNGFLQLSSGQLQNCRLSLSKKFCTRLRN